MKLIRLLKFLKKQQIKFNLTYKEFQTDHRNEYILDLNNIFITIIGITKCFSFKKNIFVLR